MARGYVLDNERNFSVIQNEADGGAYVFIYGNTSGDYNATPLFNRVAENLNQGGKGKIEDIVVAEAIKLKAEIDARVEERREEASKRTVPPADIG